MKSFIFNFILSILLCFNLSGCFQWAARAKNKLPKQTALEKTYNYSGKVIIVGAGAAGLAAAKVFEKNNIEYLILEATERYGGRLKKDTILADFPIDVGAEWLHSTPITLNKLKGKKGEEIDEELIPYRLENTASWDGKEYKLNSDWINSLAYNFMPESKFKKSTWYDFIDKNIAKDVKHKIKFNSPVIDIDYSEKKIIITTKSGKKYESDKVLVTVSIGVLKSKLIRFKPEMTIEKQEAIKSIVFEPGFKVVMKFNEKFYPDAIECEVENGEKVYYDIAFKKESKANILGFLCKGDLAQKYYELDSENEIISDLVEELDLMFDGKASLSFSGEYILENWGKYDYTLGTWTTAALEKKSNLKILNIPLDKKVYFAGEIYDPYQQMGVPGAILSGYFSADKLLTE
jgi:monoamine oxidase